MDTETAASIADTEHDRRRTDEGDPAPPAWVFTEEDLIDTYTRAQALEDGALVDVSILARAAGLRWPTALTAGAWAEYAAEERRPRRARRARQPATVIGPWDEAAAPEDRRHGPARSRVGWRIPGYEARRSDASMRALRRAGERRRVHALLGSMTHGIAAARRAVLFDIVNRHGVFKFVVLSKAAIAVEAPTPSGSVSLVLEVGPGDAGEPVVTIMRPEDR